MKSKKELLKFLKIILTSGSKSDEFYTESISAWTKDGDEDDITVRAAKLLRTQNRDYMCIIFGVIKFLENKKKI